MNQTTSQSELNSNFEYDPAYLNALKELYVMIGIWGVSLVWTVGYCGLFAYQAPGSTQAIPVVWGIPTWVIWGIVLPWVTCGLLTAWFAMFYIKQDDADILAEDFSPETPPTIKQGSPS
ncbi:MAG: hypothetical protein JKY95_03805 [Planctomycetaceae bacterium]|nr:hypothetical protein [Planctomycetaceae bacterium]